MQEAHFVPERVAPHSHRELPEAESDGLPDVSRSVKQSMPLSPNLSKRCRTEAKPGISTANQESFIEDSAIENELEATLKPKNSKTPQNSKTQVLLSRLDLIREDILTHPLKYKIASEPLGIDPEKIYELRQA